METKPYIAKKFHTWMRVFFRHFDERIFCKTAIETVFVAFTGHMIVLLRWRREVGLDFSSHLITVGRIMWVCSQVVWEEWLIAKEKWHFVLITLFNWKYYFFLKETRQQFLFILILYYIIFYFIIFLYYFKLIFQVILLLN